MKEMKAKFCAWKYRELHGNWGQMYQYVYNALESMGADIQVSQYLKSIYPTIVDEEDALYIYNHTNIEQLKEEGYHLGKQTIVLKPTAPTPDYFSIDSLGYASYSSVAYDKPNFENIEVKWDLVERLKKQKSNKWSDRQDLIFTENKTELPDNHILILCQMQGDETVTVQSFGNHWHKIEALVKNLKGNYPLVIKVHPTMKAEECKIGNWEYYEKVINYWISEGITVIYGMESIHDILPKTKVAIVENSTSGLECMMYDVPVISFGYPEYHWVTKDLRHLPALKGYINDLSWWSKDNSRKFLYWYITEYLCYDQESTTKRIKELLNGK